MDKIEYKLKSQNPTLISHATSILIEIIMKKSKVEKDISKIPEFKLLSSKCNSDDFTVSISACQALVVLFKVGLCNFESVLATFMVCLSSKNYEAITVIVSQLLILDWKTQDKTSEYTLQVPNQHPFITILKQEKHSWKSVLNQMKLIMHRYDDDDEQMEIMERSIELLRPVFLYILCDPSVNLNDGCKQGAWQLVIKSNHALDLQTEILLWLCTNRGHACIDTSYRILELAELSLLKGDTEYCTGLIPLLVSLTIQLLEYGHESVGNFDIISDLIEQSHHDIGDITIILMAEVILICPATYLPNVFHICSAIINKMPCNIILLNALAASLLKWLAYPSLLCSGALTSAKELIRKIISRIETDGDGTVSNKVLLMLSHSNRHIRFYTDLIRSLYSVKDDIQSWLENLSLAQIDLRYMCKLVLCGIFLHSNDPSVIQKTCHILVQIARQINVFASHMLSLVLHKLTKLSYDSSTSKYLLSVIPEFAMSKENLPIVVHTLDTLLNNGDQALKYFAIQLYTKALENESRCYRFLSAALMDTMEQDQSWQSTVACARAIKFVCENRPEFSEELVPLLSQILNRCSDLNGGTASALALDSISALCKSTVIGISSTWKILAPKMRKEKRTVVLESLCDFLAGVPSFPFQSGDDYECFFNDIVTLLWNYVVCEDTRVANSALKALKFYHIAQIPLSALPQDFRSDIASPHAYSGKAAVDEAEKPESALIYVPGACWIQMLKKVNRSVQTAAGDLLISYIEEELNTYRSQIYNWPRGEPHDFKYLPDKSVIKAVGECLRRGNKSNPKSQRVMVECLRVFAYKYTKPLPNVKWDFLEEAMQISEEAKEYSFSIASYHSPISLSAKLLVEKFLSTYSNKPALDAGRLLLNEKYLVFYSNLPELCRAFQSNNLKQFLETSLDYVIDKILISEQSDAEVNILFDRIMRSYVAALKCDTILVENRTLLSNLLTKIFEKIDLTSKCFAEYFAAVMELSVKEVERMILPSMWWEVTLGKLKNAIAVNSELALRKFTDTPLVWLNESINTVTSNPVAGLQEYLFENIQKVHAELRLEKYCIDWILDFMSRIDAIMVNSSHEKNNIVFHCDILFISVICLSGMDCVLLQKELLTRSPNVRIKLFPQAISMLTDRQIWKSTTRQIMNWLNHMRTSSIPDTYKSAFQSSLILLRHEEDYNIQWTNYLSVKTSIHTYN